MNFQSITRNEIYGSRFRISEVSKGCRRLDSEFAKPGLFGKKEQVTLITLTSTAIMFLLSFMMLMLILIS